jgi:uncharacterized protein YkwD
MILRSTFSRLLLFFMLVLAAGCRDDAPVEPPPTGTVGDVTIATVYDTAPNVGSCSEGVLKESERQKVLNYLNAIRANHGLPAVQYNHADDRGTAKASLIIAANSTLSHTPASTASCWTQEGFDASGTSNIAIGTSFGTTLRSSESFIDLWIKDSTVQSLGHRRWLLNPFLKFISFGRVDKVVGGTTVSGSVIKVIYTEQQALAASTPEFVAFPFHETSARLYNSGIFMSFSVLADRSDFWKNGNVSYAAASITIRTEGGDNVPVTIVGSDGEAYGLANVILWTAPVANNTRYLVTVRNVQVGGVPRDFEYWFTTKTTV